MRVNLRKPPRVIPRENELASGDLSQDLRQRAVKYCKTSQRIQGTTFPVMVLGQNSRRLFASIVNQSAEPVWICFGVLPLSTAGAGLNEGIYLRSLGGSMTFGLATDLPYLGPVYAVAAAVLDLAVMES